MALASARHCDPLAERSRQCALRFPIAVSAVADKRCMASWAHLDHLHKVSHLAL